MKSTEKKQPSKKVLFEAVNLIKSFALFENDDLAKLLRKHIAQLNDIKPHYHVFVYFTFFERKVQHVYLVNLPNGLF